MLKNIFMMLIILLAPMTLFAEQKTINCEPPQGTRIDYFVNNSANLQNQTFIMGRDRVSGMNPKIILNHQTKQVAFDIGNAPEMHQQKGNMQVLMFDEDQISFTGLVNGAPILATYYPKMNILIYSQQSIWPGPNYQGARAVIFFAKCSA